MLLVSLQLFCLICWFDCCEEGCVAMSRTLEHLLRITLAGWDGCYYSETFQHDKFPFFSSANSKLRLLLIPAITQQSNSVSEIPLLPSYHVLYIEALYSIVWQWMWINDIVPREAELFARNFLPLSACVWHCHRSEVNFQSLNAMSKRHSKSTPHSLLLPHVRLNHE